MNVEFYELALGAEFRWRGQRYRKLAMCMAEREDPDGRRTGSILYGGTEVESEGPFLSAEGAARWKPVWGAWTPVIEGRDMEARELGGA